MNKIVNYFKSIPVVFPIVSIYLISLSVYTCMEWWSNPDDFRTAYLLKPIPILIYTLFWLGASFKKRWSAMAFVVVAIVHLGASLFLKNNNDLQIVLENGMIQPMPLGLLFAIIILLYFRKIK